MGCGSSTQVQSNNNAVQNGSAKQDAQPPPPAAATNKEGEGSPKNKRKSSASSSSSSGSSRSSVRSHKKENIEQTEEQKPPPQEPQPTENEKDKENEEVKEKENEEVKKLENEKEDETKKDETDAQEQPKFTEEALKSFVELESEIKDLENKNQESIIQNEYQRLLELHKTIEAQVKRVEELKQQTLKEYQDVVQISDPSVRALFMNQTQHDAQVAKEQQEYLDALNKQEVAEQELNNIKEQYKNMYNAYNNHIQNIKADREKLQSLRFKQEQLLGQIFNDSYGSDKEWKLEMELDLLAEKKERIKTAHYKWTNAQNFTTTAAAQINWATKRWGQIFSHNVQAQMVKYQMTAETRNHLVAAIQNLRVTHKYLSPIQVPYHTEKDIMELENSLNTIFHDVQVIPKYRVAHANFAEHFNKSINLLNWIKQVVDHTINPDFEEVKKTYHEKYFELKEERMTLIKNIIKEKLGVEMNIEVKKEEYQKTEETVPVTDQQVITPGEVTKEEGDEQAPEPEAQSEEPPAEIPPPTEEEAKAAEGANTDAPAESTGEEQSENKPRVKAVPLSELAPAPNQEDLFGNIDQLKKKHEEEIAEFEKAQEMNKARVEQGLQERLQARRNRRKRMQLHNAETAALSGDNDSSLPPPM